MGPEDLSTRPKVLWDIRKALWTDLKGSQEGYFSAIKQLKNFHARFSIGNSDKILSKLQGIVLLFQIYGTAIDLCKKVSENEANSENGAIVCVQSVSEI